METLKTRGLGERLLDFRTSLLLVRDSLRQLSVGESHFIVPIFSQLRSLLLEKRRDNDPLLFHICQVLGFEPQVYWLPSSPESMSQETGLERPLFLFGGFPMGIRRELPVQQRTSLQLLLQNKICYMQNQSFSLADIIKICAEKGGGAHWAKALTTKQRDLLDLNIVGIRPAHQAVASFSRVIADIGQLLLSRLSRQSVHIFLIIPDQEVKGATEIFFLGYSDGSNSIRLVLGEGKRLRAELKSYNGDVLQLECCPEFSADRLHHVEVSHELDSELRSSLTIRLDGVPCGEVRASLPVIYDARSIGHDCRFNYPVEAESTGISFGLGEFIVLGETSETSDGYARERMEAYYRSSRFDQDTKIVSLEPGTRGLRNPSSVALEFEGPADVLTIQKYRTT